MRHLFYDPEIGASTYSFLSGITHGLPASLSPFFAVAEGSENPLAMWERREAVLDAHTVNLVAGLLVMGAVPVLDDQHRYLAVSPSQKTQHAVKRALSQVQATFD